MKTKTNTKKTTKNTTAAKRTNKTSTKATIVKRPSRPKKTKCANKSASFQEITATPVADNKDTGFTNVSAPSFAFGSPERLRNLAELIHVEMSCALASGETSLVGPYAEIKHALHELASLKEQLAAKK